MLKSRHCSINYWITSERLRDSRGFYNDTNQENYRIVGYTASRTFNIWSFYFFAEAAMGEYYRSGSIVLLVSSVAQ